LSIIKYNNTQIKKPPAKRLNILLLVLGPFNFFIERKRPIIDNIIANKIRTPIIVDIK
jgi:hypothetical protein